MPNAYGAKTSGQGAKKKKPARKPATRYREAFASAARRNSGGKY